MMTPLGSTWVTPRRVSQSQSIHFNVLRVTPVSLSLRAHPHSGGSIAGSKCIESYILDQPLSTVGPSSENSAIASKKGVAKSLRLTSPTPFMAPKSFSVLGR